jgi:CMP-N,N'-diacetyllegionaminic acid synthase
LNILAIIPARGGSKGIPRKNIQPLAGKPLVSYVILAALHASSVTRTVVSTDDQEIAEIALQYGAEVPFLRPAELAGDEVPDFPVLLHVVNHLREHEGWNAEVLVHLRPTYPLITPDDIDQAVTKLLDSQADSARTVCLVSYHPYLMYVLKDRRLLPLMETDRTYFRRQDLPPIYRTSGVDVTRTKVLFEERRILGGHIQAVITEPDRVIDIDTPHELALAECLLRVLQKHGDVPGWWR